MTVPLGSKHRRDDCGVLTGSPVAGDRRCGPPRRAARPAAAVALAQNPAAAAAQCCQGTALPQPKHTRAQRASTSTSTRARLRAHAHALAAFSQHAGRIAARARLHAHGGGGMHRLTAARPCGTLVCVSSQWTPRSRPTAQALLRTFKTAQRHVFSHAIVNMVRLPRKETGVRRGMQHTACGVAFKRAPAAAAAAWAVTPAIDNMGTVRLGGAAHPIRPYPARLPRGAACCVCWRARARACLARMHCALRIAGRVLRFCKRRHCRCGPDLRRRRLCVSPSQVPVQMWQW